MNMTCYAPIRAEYVEVEKEGSAELHPVSTTLCVYVYMLFVCVFEGRVLPSSSFTYVCLYVCMK